LYSNSGIQGGLFLEKRRIAKPNSPIDNPEYYQPQDFAIGANIEAFKHKFIITDADEYVLKYMKERPDEFSAEIISSLENKQPQKE
jgi:hypothetical protein